MAHSPTDIIRKQVSLKAPPARVWRALADAREFGAWFRVDVDGPFVVGQPAEGAITHPGYEHLRWRIVVEAMEPESRFAFRWHPYAVDPTVDYSAEAPTHVEFRLEPEGGGTRLTVTESGFDRLPAHRRDLAYRMNDGGWAAQMDNVRAHVDA
jgi:uncharacterized protein YndB with AHSA1/START domain